MRAIHIRSRFGACLTLIATSLALSGCFDFEQSLTLKGSGAGSLEVMLRMDPAFQGALEDETLLGAQASPVTITREVRDGQYVQEESVSFNALPELRLQNETLFVENVGKTAFGLGPKRLRFTRAVDGDDTDTDSYGVLDTVFQGRTYTFSVQLPGWIQTAHPLTIGEEIYEPSVSGNKISWDIPMGAAMSAGRLVYSVEFLAYMDVDGNIQAERVDRGLVDLVPGISLP